MRERKRDRLSEGEREEKGRRNTVMRRKRKKIKTKKSVLDAVMSAHAQ